MIVSCPNCGQQLKGDPGSIGTCPKCQTRLQFPEGDSNQGEPITCPHCGQVQRYKDGRCINCGKMLSESGSTPKNGKDRKKKKNKTKVIVLSVILALIVGACVWGYKLVQKKEYIDTLYDFQYNVIFGASAAEDLGNLTRSVWYDAIFEEYDPETWEYVKNEYDDYVSDFNVALQNLSNDSDIKDKKDLITSFQKDATQNIKDLAGGFYSSWYKYPSINEGFESMRVFSWKNYDSPMGDFGDYANSYYSGFSWNTQYDDYIF